MLVPSSAFLSSVLKRHSCNYGSTQISKKLFFKFTPLNILSVGFFFSFLDLSKPFHHILLKLTPHSQSSSFSKQPPPHDPTFLPSHCVCYKYGLPRKPFSPVLVIWTQLFIWINHFFTCANFTFKFYFLGYLVLGAQICFFQKRGKNNLSVYC